MTSHLIFMTSGTVLDGHSSRAVSDIQDNVQRHKTVSEVCLRHSTVFKGKPPLPW